MVLSGHFVSLEPPGNDEADEHLIYLNDTCTMQHLWFLGPGLGNWTHALAEERIKDFMITNNTHSGLIFSIRAKNDRRLVGQCGLKGIDRSNLTAEFGIIVHKDYWGLPYGREATFLVLDHGFRQMGLHRISFITAITNVRARRFLASFSAVGEGLMRESVVCEDKYVDQLLLSILSMEWEEFGLNLQNRKSRIPGGGGYGKAAE
jgi:RimJ/RimL family protein N-acetyltransferase